MKIKGLFILEMSPTSMGVINCLANKSEKLLTADGRIKVMIILSIKLNDQKK